MYPIHFSLTFLISSTSARLVTVTKSDIACTVRAEQHFVLRAAKMCACRGVVVEVEQYFVLRAAKTCRCRGVVKVEYWGRITSRVRPEKTFRKSGKVLKKLVI